MQDSNTRVPTSTAKGARKHYMYEDKGARHHDKTAGYV